MTVLVFQLLGGIGLFLFGMVLLTDGLKYFAGEALRRALVRFTGTPIKAFGSGALVTLLVQSSSATTVTVIGFVSAGLLTFPQAIGVVFGASLGTTGTGWIVSVLGLKVNLGFYALPVVGAGAFLKLLGRARWKGLGAALGGFGLIFVGIETLQEGMTGLSNVWDLASLPATGFTGHFFAMSVGILMTVIMQSSSAAVATTLTGLHAGAVGFEQAASLVIGAAIGTTVTGALAVIGGSVSAKRTACAHIVFNLATGLIALILLPVFLKLISWAQVHLSLEPGAVSLAAFHSIFIGVGVLIFLPMVHPFARVIERLISDKEGFALVNNLDDSLLLSPAVALEASRRALAELAVSLCGVVSAGVAHPSGAVDRRAGEEIGQALGKVQEFFSRIPPLGSAQPPSEDRMAQIHAIDHLTRLHAHLSLPPGPQRMLRHPRLWPLMERCRAVLGAASTGLAGKGADNWWEPVRDGAAELSDLRRKARPTVLAETARGEWSPSEALDVLDAVRWLDRVSYHIWRVTNYLAGPRTPEVSEDTEH